MHALQAVYSVVTERWLSFTTVLIFLITVWVIPSALHYMRMAAIPLVGGHAGSLEKRRQAYLTSSRDIYNEGYRKVRPCGGYGERAWS